jgi:hypothetical protein
MESPELISAITALAEATSAHAKATAELARGARELAAQNERMWLALPPRTRAMLLGISPRAERYRRNKAEIQRLAN